MIDAQNRVKYYAQQIQLKLLHFALLRRLPLPRLHACYASSALCKRAHTHTHIRTPSMHTNEIVPHFDKLYPQFPLQIFGWCWLNKRLRRILLPATVSVYVCVCVREIECALECVCALHCMACQLIALTTLSLQCSIASWEPQVARLESTPEPRSFLSCPLSPGFSVLLCSSLL